MLKRVLWLALAMLALASSAFAEGQAGAIREAVEALRVESNIPALGLGVIEGGEVVFLGGFGEVDGRPATEHDRFRAASISKLLTAQAVMQLVQAGKVRLDDDVGRWLPALAGRGLTIRHLLSHRSGLRDLVFPLETDDPVRPEAYLKLLAALPTGKPGAAYAYTDADFNVLGLVVAKVSGEAFDAYVQRRILDPVGLPDSAMFPAPAARAGMTQPFLNKPAVRPATPRPFDIAFAPSEGLVTSAADLTRWTLATLMQDRRLLRRDAHAAMLATQGQAGGPGRRIGLAWMLREPEPGRPIAEHAGAVRGYNALVLTYPRQKRAVVILTNADDAPRWEIAAAVDRLLGP